MLFAILKGAVAEALRTLGEREIHISQSEPLPASPSQDRELEASRIRIPPLIRIKWVS